MVSGLHLLDHSIVEVSLSAVALNAKVLGTFTIIGVVVHGQLIIVDQLDAMVVLLGVDALLVSNRVDAAALPKAVARANV